MSMGPRFALWALAPQEWNESGALSESQLALRTHDNHAFVVEIYSRAFREKLIAGTELSWVFIAEIVREDANLYYAFETPQERTLFSHLRDLDSVGPKTAALAVSAVGPAKLHELLRGSLSVSQVKVSGLGPKTLDKIVAGLKEKEEKFLPLLLSGRGRGESAPLPTVSGSTGGRVPPLVLLQSMERLGLRASDTSRLYQELVADRPEIEGGDTAELLRAMLQRWGQSRGNLRAFSNPHPASAEENT